MEPQENKQLAVKKAINAHEQAAAALNDLMGGEHDPAPYTPMLARVEQNIAELQADSARSHPEDHV